MNRFIFRQFYYKDLELFLQDGEIRAINHTASQACHKTSYQSIVDRRGTAEFPMPNGCVVNDYVPFYFSPLTAFTYTIKQGNVPLRSPNGDSLGTAIDDERLFVVYRINDLPNNGLEYCFSNYALKSQVPSPVIETDIDKLGTHISWDVFDDDPMTGLISEIGYNGVCKYFKDSANPIRYQNRSSKRMAEFLIKDSVPIHLACCIVAKTDEMGHKARTMIDASNVDIPVYVKPRCYFS